MKNGILFLTLVLSILFMACSENTNDQSLDKSSSTNVEEQNTVSESEQSANTNKIEEEDAMKLNITVGNQTFVATLEDNKTANAFTAMLPMTIDMEDVNGNEKYHVLPGSVRKEAAKSPGTIHAGDIMLYGTSGLVLFYETFSTVYNYVPIGHIDDAEVLTEALGNGDVQVSYAIQ